jgi:hypothetical protein
VLLNHIEVGFARDNQIQVANVAHAEGKTHLLKCDPLTRFILLPPPPLTRSVRCVTPE